ncbi:hybrid sensor histidine kinase/response regulator [Eubacterium oxidoreducens]|uniref:Stage 0 sporulation protein A homolog n=1 Tax=Eubacterium oxidoreducens TaxID=1732 RepID=A0A1G6BCA8_EUBOX|nr:ATP-binding protein [Eubacterium oxidoreducens]SDB18240.1 His Kinase A (phospho-acceptor) domain-containing protein [Eubacterium oxidoreducens]
MKGNDTTLLQALFSKYLLVYEVNLNKDTIEVIYETKEYGTFGMDREGIYSEFNEKYTKERVNEQFVKEREAFGTIEYLKTALSVKESIEMSYTVNYGKWRKCVFIREELEEGVPAKALMCFEKLKDDSEQAYWSANTAVENSNYLQLMEALCSNYAMVFCWNLADDSYEVVRKTKMISDMTYGRDKENLGFSDILIEMIKHEVYEEDRAALINNVDVEKIRERLRLDRSVVEDFRIGHDLATTRYCKIKLVRIGSEGPIERLVVGITDMDDSIRQGIKRRSILENALKEANQVNEAKTIFLSNMSHDIRTPMNAIVGYVALAMADFDDRDAVREYLDRIMLSSRHMLDLINEVLDLVRIESGWTAMDDTAENMSQIISEVEAMIRTKTDKKNQVFVVKNEIQEDAVLCDRLRVLQILQNLLTNASDYSPTGGTVTLEVSQRSYAPNGYIGYKFLVSDNGIGMEEAFQAHLFEPFERENTTTESGVAGIGLGLAIVKQLVEMMGGTISFKSIKGQGTTFIVFLEFKVASQKHEEKVEQTDLEEDVKKSITHLQTPIFEGRRFLAVEDNLINLEIISKILNHMGAEVESAIDGKQAVDKVSATKPGYYDCVLMDVQMPVMDGYESTRQIRALENQDLANVPIIGVSANVFKEDRIKGREAGMNAYIAKPIDISELKEIIKNTIEGN